MLFLSQLPESDSRYFPKPADFAYISPPSQPSILVEAEEHRILPAVRHKEVDLVVVGRSHRAAAVPGRHIHLVAAKVVPDSEEVVHIVLGLGEAVRNHSAAGRSLAEEDHHSHPEDARRHKHPDRHELVVVVVVSHPCYRNMNQWHREATSSTTILESYPAEDWRVTFHRTLLRSLPPC
jgi:hypothetical protein